MDVDAIFNAQKLARLNADRSKRVEAIVAPDARRRAFFRVAGAAARAYKALLPDERGLVLEASRHCARSVPKQHAAMQQARDLLAPVYGWFTEGSDTRDLKEAKALLDKLAS